MLRVGIECEMSIERLVCGSVDVLPFHSALKADGGAGNGNIGLGRRIGLLEDDLSREFHGDIDNGSR